MQLTALLSYPTLIHVWELFHIHAGLSSTCELLSINYPDVAWRFSLFRDIFHFKAASFSCTSTSGWNKSADKHNCNKNSYDNSNKVEQY